MKKRLEIPWGVALAIFGLLCLACSSGGSIMSMHSFHEIPVGASQEEVIAAVGKPYAVHQLPNGEVEYEYIESLKIGAQDVNERHYFLLLKDGRVVSKRIKQEAPAGYTIDSYDMQTTQTGKATPSAEK